MDGAWHADQLPGMQIDGKSGANLVEVIWRDRSTDLGSKRKHNRIRTDGILNFLLNGVKTNAVYLQTKLYYFSILLNGDQILDCHFPKKPNR